MRGISLKNICQITMGQAPPGTSYNVNGEGLALIAGAGDFGERTPDPHKFTTSPFRKSSTGDIILCIRATIGDTNWSEKPYCLGRGVAGLQPNSSELDSNYLWYWIGANKKTIARHAKGSTFKQIKKEDIENLKIPLPPLTEQKRIAAILDKADAIRRKRQAAINLADDFLRATFLDMFGDPVTNPKGWGVKSFGDIASNFSDGPFGSNLKSSHYVNAGVRVIRLQNIGTGRFIDKDKAFISEAHFNSLAKHKCIPGDVIIGTLGNPNLRACILPLFISHALNKADCIQFRPNINQATSEFICSLINYPGMLALAFHLMHGQTRTRVSMGTLRELLIPVPPISLQKKFSTIYCKVHKLFTQHNKVKTKEKMCFNSLSQRAFRGEL